MRKQLPISVQYSNILKLKAIELQATFFKHGSDRAGIISVLTRIKQKIPKRIDFKKVFE